MSDCKCDSNCCGFVQHSGTANEEDIGMSAPYTIWTTNPEDHEEYCPELVGKNVVVFLDGSGIIELSGTVEKVTADYILLDSGFVEFSNILLVKIIKE